MVPLENPDIKEIICLIHSMPTYGIETVFRDWAECFAITLQNGCDLLHDTEIWKKREERYLTIIKKYKKDEVDKFCRMMSHLILAFDRDPFQDYLGSIYMELFGGQKKLGQCFTPIDVCKVCTQTTIGDNIPEEVRTLGDECCGGGAMLIAACACYFGHHVDYQKYLKIYCGDIDALCVHMTYIQLSLIGARAEVWHRDALSRKVYGFGKFVTPMEMLLLPTKYINFHSDDYPKDGEVDKVIESQDKEKVSLDSLVEED